MTYRIILNSDDMDAAISSQPAVAVYFSGRDCGVCEALLPRVEAMIQEDFPEIALLVVQAEASPELAAQLSIFSVPALLVYLDGKLFLREVRHINLAGIQSALDRPYSLMFD